MDRLEAMSILLEAVEGGSLSAAGRRLGIPLATVSRRLSELEDYLKIRLLIRGSRKLMLTDAGRDYLAACRRILEEISEAERVASGEYRAPQGELLISAPVFLGRFYLAPIILDFLAAYPDVKVRLAQTDRAVHLLEEHVDVAVRLGALTDPTLVAIRVGLVRRVLCASPKYLQTHGAPSTPKDLASHACIVFDAVGDQWGFVVNGASFPMAIRSRLHVTTAEVATDAAVTGAGIAWVLSYHVSEQIADGRLQLLLESFEPPALPISLIYPSQRQVPLKLRAFLDFATPRLRQRIERSIAALQ